MTPWLASAMAQPMRCMVSNAGQERSAQGVQGPGTPPKTSKKAARRDAEARTGSAASKKRQSHIDELLHKTRRGATAKMGKAALSRQFCVGEQPWGVPACVSMLCILHLGHLVACLALSSCYQMTVAAASDVSALRYTIMRV